MAEILPAWVAWLGFGPEHVDLLLDMEAVEMNQVPGLAAALVGVLATFPLIHQWRSVTIAAAGFPESLTGLQPGMHSIPRADYHLWASVSWRASRVPAFGDYAIAGTTLPDIDPRMMKSSCNIRYTTTDTWLVARGLGTRNAAAGGFGQFVGLAQQIVARTEYSGQGYSAGDRLIDNVARGIAGTGNLTTWRQAGTNRHITFTVRQLSNPPAPSEHFAPPPPVPPGS